VSLANAVVGGLALLIRIAKINALSSLKPVEITDIKLGTVKYVYDDHLPCQNW
jgi:hypothetical protein